MSPEQQHQMLLEKPALPSPPGLIPNFVNPSSTRDDAYTISLLTVVTLAVCMRIYMKLRTNRQLFLEDYVMLIAWIMYAIGIQTMKWKLCALPMGVHQWDMKIKQLIKHLYLYTISSYIYCFTILPLKVAIILQILRIFSSKGQRNFIYWAGRLLLWANVVFYVFGAITLAFSCSPREKNWDPTIKGGHCLNHTALYIISSSINTLSDVLMFILPQLDIWSLRMTLNKKIGLSAVFSIGLLACTFSAIRLYNTILLQKTEDRTYQLAVMSKWAEPEIACGFLVYCLPVTPKFVNFMGVTRVFYRAYARLEPLVLSPKQSSQVVVRGSNGSSHGRYQQEGPALVSDIDFHELVRRTNDTKTTTTGIP